MPLPATVKIGHLRYKVTEVADLHRDESDGDPIKLMGCIDSGLLTIKLCRDMPDALKPMVLMHEIVHGVCTHAGKSGISETLVETLGYGLAGVFMDNPALLNYLQKEAKT